MSPRLMTREEYVADLRGFSERTGVPPSAMRPYVLGVLDSIANGERPGYSDTDRLTEVRAVLDAAKEVLTSE